MNNEEQYDPSNKPTNDEVDFETLAALLDTALSSDSPAVQDQLKKLLMVAALTSSTDPLRKAAGPFQDLVKTVVGLNRRVSQMEAVIDQVRGHRYPKDSDIAMEGRTMLPKQWPASVLKETIDDKWLEDLKSKTTIGRMLKPK